MSKFVFVFCSILLILGTPLCIAAEVDIEEYGKLPGIRDISISPNGKFYAFILNDGDVDYFVVHDVETKQNIAAINASNIKARSTSFLTNNHVLLRASETTRTFGYRGQREHSGAIVYNIETQEMDLLLKGTEDIHPAQTGLGRIVGFNSSEEELYMPAFAYSSSPPYNLYRVNLNTGRGRIHAKGRPHTVDWFVGSDGQVLAREDYDESKKEHRIYSKISGKWQQIYLLETDIPQISVQALDANNEALLFVDAHHDRDAVYSLSLTTGEIKGPLFSRSDADIQYIETDTNRNLTAIVYSGFKLDYDFVEQRLNEYFLSTQETFPRSNIQFLSATDDNKTMIVKVSGEDAAGSYIIVNMEDSTADQIASEYNVEEIAQFKALRYTARDGLKIPSLLTFPVGNVERKNMPLIVLPHGGPESYDGIGFDWLTQYFAARGYAVFQPNFRGSTGFGYEFRNAGRGKWGREMQDDVTDGVNTLVAAGYIDPARVCIVGASYGGYSALAGGAYSPELYRCIVSINGVSDLPSMLRDGVRKYGSRHWVVSYWRDVIGDSKTEREKLKDISPKNFADQFIAPVLLIHGVDDTVVSINQSRDMEKALEKSDKDVELVTLRGEDHWLSSSATRLETLKAIDQFLNKHNPPD